MVQAVMIAEESANCKESKFYTTNENIIYCSRKRNEESSQYQQSNNIQLENYLALEIA